MLTDVSPTNVELFVGSYRGPLDNEHCGGDCKENATVYFEFELNPPMYMAFCLCDEHTLVFANELESLARRAREEVTR